jgi:SNF2 family DNA or RNA helicase
MVEVIENKVLTFVTRKADQIAALIPKSQILERRGDLAKVAVNWGYDEFRLLKNLKIKDVPHPILGRYKWPGIYKPFEHQRYTAAFLATHPRAFVLSDAGTGKTSAAAWAADYLMQRGEVTRVLIVCPVSIMETAWRSDLFKTVMHRTVALAIGSRGKREAVIAGGYEFVIINFDGVKVVREALEAAEFDLIIVDEANAVKTSTTGRWKALNSLVRPDTRLWLMTGTPAAQSPMDAYGLAKLANPASVPRFAGTFRDMVMTKVTQFRWIPKINAQDIVFDVLQPAIRYTKEECLDLPDMLYTKRFVPLTSQQKYYYKLIKDEMMALAAGEEITAVNAADKLNKLLQISSGAAYSTDKEVIEFDISNRFAELETVIRQTSHKVIVFVPYRHVLEKVKDELLKVGISVEAISGSVPATQRGDIIKRFQTEVDPKVILIIPQAAAHGITLTKADTVVWWGPVPSAELYIQGNARAHRAGQRNPVTVVRLQGSPVENRVYALLDGKLDLHRGLIELYQQEIS